MRVTVSPFNRRGHARRGPVWVERDRGSCPKRCSQGEPAPDPVSRPLLRGQFPRPRQCGLRRPCHERRSRLHAGGVRLRRRNFVGYILFEIPSNLALTGFGARIWIARIMISWGLVATAMGFVAGETSFYVLRFALGVAEAGFFPGIILYLTYWFPREERARIVSLFMTAVPLATVIGGPVSGVLLGLHGVAGLAGAVAIHHRGHSRGSARHLRFEVPH